MEYKNFFEQDIEELNLDDMEQVSGGKKRPFVRSLGKNVNVRKGPGTEYPVVAQLGYLDDAADGDFGPRTEAALMRLQADYGLEQTGVADIQTTLAAYYDQASFDAAFALE